MKRPNNTYNSSYYKTLSIPHLNHYIFRDDHQSLCRGTACEQLVVAENPKMSYVVRKKHYELAIANLYRAQKLRGECKPEDFRSVIDIATQNFQSLLDNPSKLLGDDNQYEFDVS